MALELVWLPQEDEKFLQHAAHVTAKNSQLNLYTEMRDSRPKCLRLKKRAEFLAVRKKNTVHTNGFIIEYRPRPADLSGYVGLAPRLGITVSKKNGNAVQRNRIKRRIKEAIRLDIAQELKPERDYVIIAKKSLLKKSFSDLLHELRFAINAK